MELTHTFTVPATVDATWAAFNDIESVAGCFPGATVTGVEGDDFTGSCKVKLGPIALVYNGSGTFLEKDDAGHRFVIEAKGKDKRGNGTAGATVTATMAAAGADATEVTVLTDLSITGKPAQFGRGVMQDVSDKLLLQFVDCLEARFQPAPAAAEAAAPAEAGAPAEAPAAAAGAAPGGPAAAETVRPAPQEETALDLGATVLPVLVKTYWKQALAVVLALLVLRRLLGRRR
jgi:carbon monoxide dehydrogenase subunit G